MSSIKWINKNKAEVKTSEQGTIEVQIKKAFKGSNQYGVYFDGSNLAMYSSIDHAACVQYVSQFFNRIR